MSACDETAPALEARDLRVAFGATVALRGVSLAVPWGARLALLGPNGAGKSTLLRVLAGLSRPTTGTVRIAGHDLAGDPFAARRLLGVVAHQTFLYDELTATENLAFYATLYDVPNAASRVRDLLDAVGLAAKRDVRARDLSRGQQQRLTIARALLHDPPILLLDEPDTGLDLAAFAVLEEVLVAGRTVLLTTHNLRQAARLCDRFALLSAGRLVHAAPMDPRGDAALEAVYRRVTGA
ncbi:MAG TPA: heme ABC exporter ATP-binding protein CcmA [Thermomicrobiales bacterium]|nr:heme ABC exporter ATP-binding protein CcmA [Thermomicrobiales bacterium]